MSIFDEGCGVGRHAFRADWCDTHSRSVWECLGVARVEAEEADRKLEKAKQEFEEMNSAIATLQIGMEQECDAKLEAREQLRVANLQNDDLLRRMNLICDAMDEFCDSTAKEVAPDVCAHWKKVFAEFKAGYAKKRLPERVAFCSACDTFNGPTHKEDCPLRHVS